MSLAFPTLYFLAPEPPLVAPAGLARLRHAITGGLPHSIPLDSAVRLVLVLPTGRARFWADLDPLAVIATSADARAPRADAPLGPVGAVDRAPLRLVALRGKTPIGSIPLVTGAVHTLPSNPGPGLPATLALTLLAWDIRAGNARGAGDFGSFVELAWARRDRPADSFATPVVPRAVVQRLDAAQRLESSVEGKPAL